jgi:hypothetical protein
MLIPSAVGPAQATEGAQTPKSATKLEKGWVGLPFDPPVAKQIKPIVPPKKRTPKRPKRSRKKKK